MAPQQQKDEKNHYFLIIGELELVEGDQVRYKKVDAIHRSKTAALVASTFGKFQVALQKQFHAINAKKSEAIPSITDVVIMNVVHLGFYTEDEFFAEAQTKSGPASPSQP